MDMSVLSADELLDALREEVDAAADDSGRADMREEATGFFFGDLPAPPDDPDGVAYADVVSTDVGDAIESVLAEIMPTFAAGPIQFVPLGPEDERAAEIESRIVHHVITTSGGYLALGQAIKSALLHRAGVIKVSWETRKVPRYEIYDRSPIEAVMAGMAAGAELIAADEDPYGAVTGMARHYEMEQAPRVDAIPLDEFLICPDAMPGRMHEARFVAQRRLMPRGDLVALGFDQDEVAALAEFDSRRYGERKRRSENYTLSESAHKSTDPIMCLDAYYRIDADGDGLAELRRVITAGGVEGYDKLLFDEPVTESPFAVGLAYLGLFTWDGISLYDKLKEVQTFKTNLMRDLSDLFRRSSRQRLGIVEYDANIDDALTSVRGGVVRCKTPNGVFAIPEAHLPQGSFELLGYMDKLRRDKGGGAIDTAHQAMTIGGDSAHGVERVMSSIEQLSTMLARNLAETLLKPVYRLMHNLLREHRQGAISIPGGQGWEHSQPGTWQPRAEMALSLGMSTAERQRRAAALGQVLQAQTKAMESGLAGQLVDLPQMHNALLDMGRMMELSNPEQYFINPASPEAQQAAQQKQQAAEAEKQQQQQLAMLQYEILPKVEQIKAESRAQVQMMQSQTDTEIAEMRAQVDAMKLAIDAKLKGIDSRIRLLDIESRVDAEDAANEIDMIQARHGMGQPEDQEEDDDREAEAGRLV
jgi:hypothetical protein